VAYLLKFNKVKLGYQPLSLREKNNL